MTRRAPCFCPPPASLLLPQCSLQYTNDHYFSYEMSTESSLGPLPVDILYQILLCIPNYATLRSTIRSSRTFYNVFRKHKPMVLRAVILNDIGPNFYLAVGIVKRKRFKEFTQTVLSASVARKSNGRLDGASKKLTFRLREPVDLFATFDGRYSAKDVDLADISEAELKELRWVAKVLRNLENTFSLLYVLPVTQLISAF